MDKKMRLGLFGGAFDPIHWGHLLTAENIREQFQLDRIIFIPWGKPPKQWRICAADAEHRYNMVLLAINSNPAFEASRTEIDREGFSYTVDTVDEVSRIYAGQARIYFITGPENVSRINEWKEAARLLQLCEFITTRRAGHCSHSLDEQVQRLRSEYLTKIHIADTPLIGISSTEIRERIRNGQSIRYYVPDGVEKYIVENGLYTSDNP